MSLGFAVTTVVATLGLLVGEKREDQRLVALFKPIAALGFCAAAVANGAFESTYGQAVFVALVLSLFGDLFLIPKDVGKAFLLGLGSFLLGHVGFAVAFVIAGIDPVYTGVALGAVFPVAGIVARWLLPNVEPKMKRPVIAYIVVIASMAALSVGTIPVVADWRIPVAAAMFFVSDLSVARHRFVAPGFDNKVWGLPLYFGAQLVFAFTV